MRTVLGMSNYEPTTSRSAKVLLALFAVVICVAGALYLSGGSTSGPTLSLSNAGQVSNGSIDASVLFDGWSWATLKNDSPVWYGANSGPSPAQRLDATPITAAQVQWLAQNAPGALEAVAGRMLSTASDIVCSSSGCTTSAGAVPLSWFSDLSLVPGYGSMYAGWGIKAALYVDNLQIPQNEVALTLSARNWTPVARTLSSGAGPSGTVSVANAADAWGRNLYLESAGLGQFFVPTPAWSAKAPQIWYAPVVGAHDALLTVNPAPKTALYSRGLSVPTGATDVLNPSELTYLTSPTTGCGFALCVPAAVDATVSGYTSSTRQVCLRNDAAAKATLVIASSTWSVDFPHATHQEVLSNGGPAQKAGVPTFVSGNQTLWVATYSLYTGDALTTGQPTTLGQLSPIEVAGSIYDARHTAPALLHANAPLSTIYPTWRAC